MASDDQLPPTTSPGIDLPGPPELDDTRSGFGGPVGNPDAGAMEEIGVSGLKIFSGVVDEEFLKDLRGSRAIKVYREMSEGDATCVAMLQAIALILRAVDWRVEAAGDPGADGNHSPEAEKEKEFVESLLDDMSHPFEDTLGEILSMLVFGWSYHEIILKVRRGPDEEDGQFRSKYTDGRIGIRKLPIRSQDSMLNWEMQEDGGILGLWQIPPNGGPRLFIPIERALLFRTSSRKNSPEGVSILRSAYRSWYLKKTVEDYEAVGIERELAGLPIVSIPRKYFISTDTADKAFLRKAEKIARDIKFNQQAGIVIPSDRFVNKSDGNPSTAPLMDVKLLSAGGRRAIDTEPVIQRYSRDIARSALADFLMLGTDRGSYALSKDKSDLFMKSCESYLNQIAAVFNRFLLPRIFAYNGISIDLMPKLVPGDIAPPDLAVLGAYIQQLAAAGAPLFPDQSLSEYLHKVAGLPPPAEDAGLHAAPGEAPGPGQIDPNTGELIQPEIDPVSGRPMHEVAQEQFNNDQAQAAAAAKKPPFGKVGWTDEAREAALIARRANAHWTPGKNDPVHEEGYIYHGTSHDRLDDIDDSGKLDVHRHDHGTEQDSWPDGSRQKRSYWGKNPETTHLFLPEGKPALLRAKAADISARPERGTGDFYATKPVPTSKLEHWDGSNWHPLGVGKVGWTDEARAAALEARRGHMHPHEGTRGLAHHLYHQTIEHGVTEDDIYNRVHPDARHAAKSLEADISKRVPSDAPVHLGGHMRPDGTYTPERQAIHNKLVNDLFTPEKVEASLPYGDEKPSMHMLGGRGGSGKSFLTNHDAGGPVNPHTTVVLNSDDFKGPLAHASGLDERHAALFHEESDHVLKMASARAKKLGVNVAFDATMKTHATAATRMQEYLNAGYKVHGHYVHTSPQEAAKRSIHRYYKGGQANGRYVPPHIILGNTKNEENFDKLSPNFHSWSVWDNNGKTPRLVARSEDR